MDVFTTNPNVNGLVTANDEMVRGVLSGLQQVNRADLAGTAGHVPLIGIDGTPLALKRIRDGQQDATVNQDPYEMGNLAMAAMVTLLTGEHPPREQTT